MKRGRGRPRSSIAERVERFYRDANHVAAELAENYVRTYFHSDGSKITHVEAVELAIADYEENWLKADKEGAPPRRPHPDVVLELLRRGRTQALPRRLLRA
jgi:hypothetical protein